MTRTRLALQQFGAHLAILVGAYVSLGTTCSGSSTDVSLQRRTTLSANRTERHLQISTRSDQPISRVSIRTSPALELLVDSLDGSVVPGTGGVGGGPDVTASETYFDTDCTEFSCEELFLTLGRGTLEGDLDISLEISAGAEGSCDGTDPDFVEIEISELD